MPAPKDVLALVEKFDRHRESYESAAYNETQLRREFLDPMFAAMGWDVQNVDGTAEAYKEVIHEDAIKVGEFTKAPDYAFRIGGTRKFFVEAKKPAKKLKDDAEAAFQLRRYAWSAKLPLSILTDFQEFAVYDTRLKPSPKDKASVGRVLYFTHAEYVEKWEEIAGIFSRDAVLKGAFDKFAEAKRPKRGSLPVDEAFLKEIEGWREALAKNIAVRNQKLDVREINFAVQRVIDRIIFLRIAEDRGIEPYGRLQGLLNGKNVYARLFELFERADDRYNSGLFHFKEEKGRAERPDELTPRLKVDDDVLQTIIGDLYLPKSPYAFSVISADILGAVYEQFLGKVIRLTAGHHVKVEEKPEVRKAGGVYYTPTYIVDYIVKQTVGKLLEGKTPKQTAELKVLDPACGSGSFLIGAYQYLLDWHRDWYVEDGVEKHRKVLYQGMGGEWRLTTKERTRILLNNVYGVDIDPQAVEVTKLSLLLKVLEGGSPDVLQREFWAAHERVLPDLGNNIKCGNSLIALDFYGGDLALGDAQERNEINPFDWTDGFPEALGDGARGFDAVIGNPPYVLLQSLNKPAVFKYLAGAFRSAKYKIDTYQLFLEKGLDVTTQGGRLGFITPNTFLRNKHARALRQVILEKAQVLLLRAFFYPVFKQASVDTCILVAERTDKPKPGGVITIVRSSSPGDLRSDRIAQKAWMSHPENQFGLPGAEGADEVVRKMTAVSLPLGMFGTAYFGIQTHDRESFVANRALSRHHKPVVDGVHISRYLLAKGSEFVDFRPVAIKSGGRQSVHESTRIGVRQIGEAPVATIIPGGIYALNTIYNVFFTRDAGYSLEFILGVLQSRAVRFYWRQSFFDQKRTFPKIKKDALLSVPIPRDATKGHEGTSRGDRITSLVKQMLELTARAERAKTDVERVALERQITALDRQIDQLVYELYGLTDEEIRIVEEATAGAAAKD